MWYRKTEHCSFGMARRNYTRSGPQIFGKVRGLHIDLWVLRQVQNCRASRLSKCMLQLWWDHHRPCFYAWNTSIATDFLTYYSIVQCYWSQSKLTEKPRVKAGFAYTPPGSAVASYGALGHVPPPSTFNNFIFRVNLRANYPSIV